MRKPIVRISHANSDINGPLVGAIVRLLGDPRLRYINYVTQLNFDEHGQVIRVESPSAIYVKVSE